MNASCLCGGENIEIYFSQNFSAQYHADCRCYELLIFTLSIFFCISSIFQFLPTSTWQIPFYFSMSLTFRVPSISEVMQQ